MKDMKIIQILQKKADIRLNRIMLPKWFITKNGYNYTMEVYEDRIVLIANKEKINNVED